MILCTCENGIKHKDLAKSVKTCRETMPVPLIIFYHIWIHQKEKYRL